MIWFITGLVIGAIAVFLWCERNWYRYKTDSEAFHAAVAAIHKRYLQSRDSIRRWGEQGLISAIPPEPPSVAAFRFNWECFPETAIRELCGILECVRAASELESLLTKSTKTVSPLRRMEHARADLLVGVAEYLVEIEQRYRRDETKLPVAANPISMESFDDIYEADERERREANLAEAMLRIDGDEKALMKYRADLLSGKLSFISAEEIAREVQEINEHLEEIRSARSERRIPDLEDYEDLDDFDELVDDDEDFVDDDLDDDLDEDDDDDKDPDEEESERREGGDRSQSR